MIVGKYADHLPLYRQAQIYARQGIELDRSTLADWTGRAAWLLQPVHARLLERLKASSKVSGRFAPRSNGLTVGSVRRRPLRGRPGLFSRPKA